MSRPQRQCKACPWKTSTNPRDIPNGYDEAKHVALRRTIAKPGVPLLPGQKFRIMELPCVGWLANQLGPGNNIGLRCAVLDGRIDANVRPIGPQHETFEDTLLRLEADP